MNKTDLIEAVVLAKAARGLTWEGIAAGIGMSPVWTTSVCLGMNSAPETAAKALVELLELPDTAVAAFMAYPSKSWEQAVPQDPLVYRLYEIVGVYGTTMKELIHEKCGDGIMSAIDFTMTIDKQENPKGDRVIVTMDGKFLPYKQW